MSQVTHQLLGRANNELVAGISARRVNGMKRQDQRTCGLIFKRRKLDCRR